MTNLWVHEDIFLAKTLQKEFYPSPKFFEAAKEKIFARSCQWLIIPKQKSGPGQCVPVTLLEGYLGEPILITTEA
jgi:choline monooxygenase